MNTYQRPIEALEFRIRPASRPVIAWKPNVVVAQNLAASSDRPLVANAEPALRPAAVRAQVEATRALLQSLVAAQEALGDAARIEAALPDMGSDQARVAAALKTYELESTLDDVLVRTLDDVMSLMTERGLR